MKKASEIKTGDFVIVHLYDMTGKEISTRNRGKIFEVLSVSGLPAIKWIDDSNNILTLLSSFVDNLQYVAFELV